MTPDFCVLRMSKVPRLPHILGFGRARGAVGVPFFNVFWVMETGAFRVFCLTHGKEYSICKRMKKTERELLKPLDEWGVAWTSRAMINEIRTSQTLGLIGCSLD